MVVDSYKHCVTPYCSMVWYNLITGKKNFSGIWYAFLTESVHDHIPDFMDRCHYVGHNSVISRFQFIWG